MYKPNYTPYYQQVTSNKHAMYQEAPHENGGLYTLNNYVKKQKPKPFSVMLDIYPITDTVEHTKNYPSHNKYSKLQGIQSESLYQAASVQNQHQLLEEDEKHQMILHLNLYPKKKIKATR
jgi:hypothetical protein